MFFWSARVARLSVRLYYCLLSTTAKSKPHEALSFIKDAMTTSSGRTPVGQRDDGPKPPTTAEGAHTTGAYARLGDFTTASSSVCAKRRAV